MTEIILLLIGCLLALLFFIWLVFGRRTSSKTVMLLMDTALLALGVAAVLCGLRLRQEKYEADRRQAVPVEQMTEI